MCPTPGGAFAPAHTWSVARHPSFQPPQVIRFQPSLGSPGSSRGRSGCWWRASVGLELQWYRVVLKARARPALPTHSSFQKAVAHTSGAGWGSPVGTALDPQPSVHGRVKRPERGDYIFISELQATPLIPSRAPLPSQPLPALWGPSGSAKQGARTRRGAEAAAALEPGGAGRTWPVDPPRLENFLFNYVSRPERWAPIEEAGVPGNPGYEHPTRSGRALRLSQERSRRQPKTQLRRPALLLWSQKRTNFVWRTHPVL
ncbi:uncharacterized protein LOC115071425 [Nannospalax galili]|uniref:uncharacterized protein LOC115071425 n=1 Tax=Nannospalax galili TaxID=1026970 RepID=UPI00111C3FF1|nr:uncharacterized protein LOC115071425 [Nannospalax galili]